jgi:hypothetical protein
VNVSLTNTQQQSVTGSRGRVTDWVRPTQVSPRVLTALTADKVQPCVSKLTNWCYRQKVVPHAI